MSEIQEHLEHAEHAEHAAHNPFDRRVATTMAIVAAILAGVAMVGHRTHNQTLLDQGMAAGYDVQAGNLKIQAANAEVSESNAWAQYQAKKLRQVMAENSVAALSLLGGSADKAAERDARVKKYQEEVERYKGELVELSDAAKKKHAEIEAFNKKARAAEEKAQETFHLAHHVHAQADWLDLAHLAVELGLVVCSISLLTKKKGYWLFGIASALVGVVLVVIGLTLPMKAHEEGDIDHGKTEEVKGEAHH